MVPLWCLVGARLITSTHDGRLTGGERGARPNLKLTSLHRPASKIKSLCSTFFASFFFFLSCLMRAFSELRVQAIGDPAAPNRVLAGHSAVLIVADQTTKRGMGRGNLVGRGAVRNAWRVPVCCVTGYRQVVVGVVGPARRQTCSGVWGGKWGRRGRVGMESGWRAGDAV